MAVVVEKYGGTSVGSVERINAVAKRVLRTVAEGHQVVVVLSAMQGETNRLIELAHEESAETPRRELGMMVRTGEQLRIELLSMALQREGHHAK